jgi:hypothetical protein
MIVGLFEIAIASGLGLVLHGWPYVVAKGFVEAAIPEEVAKYAVLVGSISEREDAEIGLDIILGAAWLGLGFAAFENVLYVVQAKDVFHVGYMRALLSVPAHVMFGTIMGCLVVMAWREGRSQRHWTAAALVVPILLHGVFDSSLLAATLSSGRPTLPAASVLASAVTVGAILIGLWPSRVIEMVGLRPLRHRSSHRVLATNRTVERASRWLAIVIFGLFGLIFALAVPRVWVATPVAAPVIGSIGALMLGFMLFFWRAPVKFRQCARESIECDGLTGADSPAPPA